MKLFVSLVFLISKTKTQTEINIKLIPPFFIFIFICYNWLHFNVTVYDFHEM